MPQPITLALAGNPNSGKTSIFNSLTGARQQVANYPGVTVEKKIGMCHHANFDIHVVDLPGTYSLTAYSAEEVIARNHILDEKPDVVVNILDSTNLERNLYLTTQLMELNVPIVLAFNMSDLAKRQGIEWDLPKLSQLLGLPIVLTVGNKPKETVGILDAAISRLSSLPETNPTPKVMVKYGKEIEEEIEKIQNLLPPQSWNARWHAIKLLENDEEVQSKTSSEILSAAEAASSRLEKLFGDNTEILIAERRYGFIAGAIQETVKRTVESRYDMSDKIDQAVTHSLFGLPIFLLLMYVVFWLTFSIAEIPMSWIESFFQWSGANIEKMWPPESESMLKSLLVDGIIGGVGGVIVFLPNILILFMAISVLEDSGYMARAAFIMDRFMHKIGLHGKSFIPMLVGFGCSVPAIMSTRILENERDRLTTILVIPLVSCGARFPIYALLIPAFFPPAWHAPMLWLIYLIGISLAAVGAKILRWTVFRGPTIPFVMELPPYRVPTIASTLIHTWERGWMYLKKAGTIILAISVLLWVLSSYPKPDPSKLSQEPEQAAFEKLAYSASGRIGKFLEPALKPMGFDWKIATAFIGAFAAKEVFVAQMGIIYSVGKVEGESEDVLRKRLQKNYNPLAGFCIMLFALIATPCVATFAAVKQETRSWKWPMLQFWGLTLLAYILTVAVYQIGKFLGLA